ncbi:dTDP-4-dehydrorhamnose reductase [Stenoxybacter acetivorans]|uniref:dTDP-4-dehydrorhamnose reductase n=1 Tax=Stenoxybacter acetivorans TaxID=422441 RepID=UPI000561A068|nr:dTDP-4-dehydrorhamnose reductase [Stenoxybacter acetivorans]
MRILLTGSKGQIGQCFKNRLPEEWELIAADSKTMDITDAHNVLNMVKTFEPDVIVNAAGYAHVNQAENEVARAFAVNAQGTQNLAAAAKAVGARLIHLSTEQVFDGRQNSPITETVAPNPLNVYGKSKLAGELLALNTHVDTVIVRSSWVYSEYGENFAKIILRNGLAQKHLRLVADQVIAPTYAGDLANALIQIIQSHHLMHGIYHFTGQQLMSAAEFAGQIFQAAAVKDKAYTDVVIEPISITDNDNTKSPPYTVLDNSLLRGLLSEPIADTPIKWAVEQLLSA